MCLRELDPESQKLTTLIKGFYQGGKMKKSKLSLILDFVFEILVWVFENPEKFKKFYEKIFGDG
ncbi:MAG: hypothetical protein CME70_03035 [Halobacteriovorax sp.]|nr:hypothetical protein [Halobacteriovorax sp.]